MLYKHILYNHTLYNHTLYKHINMEESTSAINKQPAMIIALVAIIILLLIWVYSRNESFDAGYGKPSDGYQDKLNGLIPDKKKQMAVYIAARSLILANDEFSRQYFDWHTKQDPDALTHIPDFRDTIISAFDTGYIAEATDTYSRMFDRDDIEATIIKDYSDKSGSTVAPGSYGDRLITVLNGSRHSGDYRGMAVSVIDVALLLMNDNKYPDLTNVTSTDSPYRLVFVAANGISGATIGGLAGVGRRHNLKIPSEMVVEGIPIKISADIQKDAQQLIFDPSKMNLPILINSQKMATVWASRVRHIKDGQLESVLNIGE